MKIMTRICDMRQCSQGICYLNEVGVQNYECPQFGVCVVLSFSHNCARIVQIFKDVDRAT